MLQSRPRARILLPVSLLSILAVALPCASARGADLAPLRPEGPPSFSADVAITIDANARPTIAVTVTVPYPELEWVQVEDGWAGGVQITVVFEPNHKGQGSGDVWERRVVVDDFGLTRSPNTSIVERHTFDVPPGKYRVRVGVEGVDRGEGSIARGQIEVPDYSRVPVGFADLELGVVDSSGAFTPVPTRRYGLNVSQLAARAALFDRRPGAWPRDYVFKVRVVDDVGERLVQGEQRVRLEQSAQPVLVRPSESNLFVGAYSLEIELEEGKSRWRVDRSFEVEESGPPRGREYERMLEPLSYIADSREMSLLRVTEPEDQVRAWEEFWRRRDPTPETPRNEAMLEFFRRVRYAEKHFQGFGPGWRSDMGRIYIKFGPPDQIETRPVSTNMPELQIWYYNSPYRRFVFADREGFGRYVLASPGIE